MYVQEAGRLYQRICELGPMQHTWATRLTPDELKALPRVHKPCKSFGSITVRGMRCRTGQADASRAYSDCAVAVLWDVGTPQERRWFGVLEQILLVEMASSEQREQLLLKLRWYAQSRERHGLHEVFAGPPTRQRPVWNYVQPFLHPNHIDCQVFLSAAQQRGNERWQHVFKHRGMAYIPSSYLPD